jgi:CheY-like chemotaxis protein
VKLLQDFASKTFLEQIQILREIEKEKDADAISPLFSFLKTASGLAAVDMFVENTLKTLLGKDEAQTVYRLSSENPVEKKLCLSLVRQNKFYSAGPKLLELVESETDLALVFEILVALSETKPEGYLDVFRMHVSHPDPVVSAFSIEVLGRDADFSSLETMFLLVNKAEDQMLYEECSLVTYKAIRALGDLKSDEVTAFLVSKIHHRSPPVRVLILKALVDIGQPAVPFLAKKLKGSVEDERIIATNVLGDIGGKEVGTLLIETLQFREKLSANLKFAIYGALGNIKSLKVLVCLIDGLSEEEPSVLASVISSLNELILAGTCDELCALVKTETPRGKRVAQAIAFSKSVAIFSQFYEDKDFSHRVLDEVLASNDENTIDAFRKKLETLPREKVQDDLRRLAEAQRRENTKTILAVDDSRTMQAIYASLASSCKVNIVTADHGKNGLEAIKNAKQPFDLIITDMNMPEMDGITFVSKVRENALYANTTILMITTESELSQKHLATKVGVTSFFRKPFSFEQLFSKVKELLQA